MVLSSAASPDTAELVTSPQQQPKGSGLHSFTSTGDGRGARDFGIVEGWGGDEEEDVNIDSDEKDSGSEEVRLLPHEAAADEEEELPLQPAPTGGSSSQLPSSTGMRGRTESSAGPAATKEDSVSSSRDRAAKSNRVPRLGAAQEGIGLGMRGGREKVGVSGSSGRADNDGNVMVPKVVRVGSGSGDSTASEGGGTKRLDARRFRREFSAKISGSNIPVRNKTPVPDGGRMRGSVRGDAKEGKKFSKEKDVEGRKAHKSLPTEGRKANKSSPPQLHKQTPIKQGSEKAVVENHDNEKATRDERARKLKLMVQHKAKESEQSNKDVSKKRKFKDVEQEQAAERKSTLRDRGELSKQNEDKVKRGSGGQGDSGTPMKNKRARMEEEVSPLKASVPEKRTPPKRRLEKEGKSPAQVSRVAGGQKVVDTNQKPQQVKKHFRKPPDKTGKLPRQLSGDSLKKSEGETVKETFELGSLDKVFERRAARKKEKGKGENTHSKQLTAESIVAPHSTDVSGEAIKTCEKEKEEKETEEKEKENENENEKNENEKKEKEEEKEKEEVDKEEKEQEEMKSKKKREEEVKNKAKKKEEEMKSETNNKEEEMNNEMKKKEEEMKNKTKNEEMKNEMKKKEEEMKNEMKKEEMKKEEMKKEMKNEMMNETKKKEEEEENKGKEKEKDKIPVDRTPTRSTVKAQEARKARQLNDASDESCSSGKQLQDREDASISFQRRPTRSSEKAKESVGRGDVLQELAASAGKGNIPISEDTTGLQTYGVDRQLFPQELVENDKKQAEMGEGSVGNKEHLTGKRKQNIIQAEMDSSGRSTYSGKIGDGANLEATEGTGGEVGVGEEQSKLKKQRLSEGMVKDTLGPEENSSRISNLRRHNNIWHPKAPLSQSVKLTALGLSGYQRDASLLPTSDASLNRGTAPLDPLTKKPEQTLVQGEDEDSLEEGEIGSQSSDTKEVVHKFAEREDLSSEFRRDSRSGACENASIHEDSITLTTSVQQHDEPGHGMSQQSVSQKQAVEEDVDNVSKIAPSDLVDALKPKEVSSKEHDCHPDPHAVPSVGGGGEMSEPVADAEGEETQRILSSSKPSSCEMSSVVFVDIVDSPGRCDKRHGAQVVKTDEQHIPEDRSTNSQGMIRGHQRGALHSPVIEKTAVVETSEAQAVCDLTGEDRSDSDDGRASDHHNSYCEHCKQGGELLCCDGSGCKTTYHLECTDPKLPEVPSGNWYCPTCAHKRLSYGVHAVSKSVESIWDVRDHAESSGHPGSPFQKDVPSTDLGGSHNKDQKKKGRLLEGTRPMPVKNRDGVEDDYIAAVNVVVDDEEATYRPQRTTRRTDGELNVRRQSEKRCRDGDAKPLDKSRTTEGKTTFGISSALPSAKVPAECHDKEYFVKWKGISHAHNTWVPESELMKLSPKSLAKFKKKLVEGQATKWNPDWAEPQRLVDKRVSIPPRRPGGGRGRGFLGMDTQQEWFVKWKGLGYEHCTWEPVYSGIFSDGKAKELEAMFDRWHETMRHHNQPKKVEEFKKLREARFKKLESKPDWIRGRQLFPYQLDRLNQLRHRWHHHQNTIIEDEDDQEKSSMVAAFLLSLIEEYGVYRPILVVLPQFEVQSWEAEVLEFAPQVNTVVYTGSKEARGVIQRFELNRNNKPLKVQVVLTTYEVASSDFDYLSKIKWEAVVVDESQQSKMAKSHRAFLQIGAAFQLLFINDLLKYNVEELQQIIFLLQPQSPPSTIHKPLIELDESGQLQDLKDQLSKHIVRVSKPDDLSGLELREYWVGTEMTSLQVQLYCSTLTKHYNLLQSGRLRTDPDSPSLHDFANQLRLGSVKQDLPASQSLIDAGVEASEKWQLIHAMISVLHAQGHRVVILSQSLMQLFFFDDYLRQQYGPDSYELVDTRYAAPRKNQAVQKFNAKDSSRFVFLLRTGASGFSLKLKEKDIIIIHDSDLNPANDSEYLRKVLHKVDGGLKVFRLYQRFTLEEGSMVYVHQKKLEPDPKPLSLKILQQLLRWKVQHILELDCSSLEKPTVPKGKQKANVLIDKAAQQLERVKNILEGNLGAEVSTANGVDEVCPEEDLDSLKEFWSSLLKDRYAELQDREEQANAGKGLRQRKKVQYSEEALALAPYTIVEGEEHRRKRKRPQVLEPTSTLGPRDKAKHSSLQSSPSTPKLSENFQDEEARPGNDVSSRPGSEIKDTARSEPEVTLSDQVIEHAPVIKLVPKPVVSDHSHEQQNQAPPPVAADTLSNKTTIIPGARNVKSEEISGHAPSNAVQLNKHASPAPTVSTPSTTSSQVDNGRRLRMEQKQQLLRMEPELSRICEILHVSESISSYSQQLLSHVMNSFRMPKEPRELVVMVELSLCLVAATHFHEVLEHLPAVSQVGEKLNVPIKKEEFASVYTRLEGMCKSCVAPPALVQKGAGHAEVVLPDAAHVDMSPKPTSAQNESLVETIPTSEAPEQAPVTKDKSHSQAGQQASSHKNALSKDGEPDVAMSLQDKLPRIVCDEQVGESGQLTKTADCQRTGFQDTDPTVTGHSERETAQSHHAEVNSGDQQHRREPVAIAAETMQYPLLQTGEVIRARLKSDKDTLLYSWLAKQKSEVQEFNATCAKDRDARQKVYEQKKAQIMSMNNSPEQTAEKLRNLGALYTSKLKFHEREAEEKRQAMNRKQRVLRDKVNALYAKLQLQVAAGLHPDLLSEAQTLGLTSSPLSSPSKALETGPTQSMQAHQLASAQVHQNHYLLSSQVQQNEDLQSQPTAGRTRVQSQHQPQPHPPPQQQLVPSPSVPESQPQSQRQSPHQPQPQLQPQPSTQPQPPMQPQPQLPTQPQPQPPTQPQPQCPAQLQPQPPTQPQPQPLTQPQPQPQLQPQPQPQPQPLLHLQHQPQPQVEPLLQLPDQHLPHLEPIHSSQPLSQAMPVQQASNVPLQVSAHGDQITLPARYAHPLPQRSQSHSNQQSTQTQERLPSPHSHVQIPGSVSSNSRIEPIPASSSHGLGSTQVAIEQRTVQPSVTQHVRLSPMMNASASLQSSVSQAAQAAMDLQPRLVQAPTSLQPRISQTAQTVQAPTSLQARVSQTIQASPSLHSRVPHVQSSTNLQPRISQTVEAPGSLQPRGSQSRRQTLFQQAGWHTLPSPYQTPTPHARVQTQQPQTGGHGHSVPSAGLSSGLNLAASQARSHLQNVTMAGVQAPSSQSPFGADPLAHEETRLRTEQEKVKLIYAEETKHIKAQYDREAAELRRRYEGLLNDRARTVEQRSNALKENLEKVIRNRLLAEALIMRSFLDQQKARHVPSQASEAITGSGRAGHSSSVRIPNSGRGHLQPSHQTNIGGVRNAGRSTGSGGYQGNVPSPAHAPGRGFAGAQVNAGSGPVPSTNVGGQSSTSRPGLLHNSSPNSRTSLPWPGGNQNACPTGFASGASASSALPTGSFPSTAAGLVVESPSQVPNLTGLFQFPRVSRRPQSNPLPSQFTSTQQRSWTSHREVASNFMVPPSTTRVEQPSSHHSTSQSVLSTPAPATPIATAASSQIVTEAVVVSVSPNLSPSGEALPDLELAGHEFIQTSHNNLVTEPFSLDEFNDLSLPPSSANQVNSSLQSRIQSGALMEGEAPGEISAPTHGQNRVASESPIIGLNINPPPSHSVIYLSDDDD